MKEIFLKIAGHEELANFFGMTYAELANIIYNTNDAYKYRLFFIPKRNGGYRRIASPSKKLKDIQVLLKDVLYEIYPTKPPVHGFAIDKSIVTNAERHLDKKFILNIDLLGFFKSIHFGRIRNLYKSNPFFFNNTVSTILAQICCFHNSLPQGAPTSPILSNMIAWKLDSQLQYLAKNHNSTYTRYADDITFSFTCNKQSLPRDIVDIRAGEEILGNTLTNIIENNGFKINHNKVRLCNTFSRMEVTGLTVNELINVRRQYVRQLFSMLHAWRKFGYELAEKEYNEKYDRKHRASDRPKSFFWVIKGKLCFLRSVRPGPDPIFNKLATQFNDLSPNKYKFKLFEVAELEQNAIDALWVIEVSYTDPKGEANIDQGSAFQLKDIGIVTCAHVVSNKRCIYKHIEAFKYSNPAVKYKVKVDRICHKRDVAICSIIIERDRLPPEACIPKSYRPAKMGDNVKLLGFPVYAPGHQYYMVNTRVAQIYVQSTVNKFEIDKLIRVGNSGGPVINAELMVVGIALEGARQDAGNNACLAISEIDSVLSSDEYKI